MCVGGGILTAAPLSLLEGRCVSEVLSSFEWTSLMHVRHIVLLSCKDWSQTLCHLGTGFHSSDLFRPHECLWTIQPAFQNFAKFWQTFLGACPMPNFLFCWRLSCACCPLVVTCLILPLNGLFFPWWLVVCNWLIFLNDSEEDHFSPQYVCPPCLPDPACSQRYWEPEAVRAVRSIKWSFLWLRQTKNWIFNSVLCCTQKKKNKTTLQHSETSDNLKTAFGVCLAFSNPILY